MGKHIHLVLIAMALLCGCSKQESVSPAMEKKISGTWRVEKATFTPRNSFDCEDISASFPDKFVFNKDYTLTLVGNLIQAGSWSLQQATAIAADGSCAYVYILNLNASGFDITGTSFSVTNKRMSFEEEKGDGFYRYRLRRE